MKTGTAFNSFILRHPGGIENLANEWIIYGMISFFPPFFPANDGINLVENPGGM